MNHSEAVVQMAAERYLLDELGPDVRDEFEEHLFECPECVVDVRAGDVFLREARVQLPALVADDEARAARDREKIRPAKEKRDWFAWLRPAYLAPAFAMLLAVVAYQNFVTLPGLEQAANEPRLAPLTPVRGATRGSEHQTLTTSHKLGLTLPVDLLPVDMPAAKFASYAFTLTGPDGKSVWNAAMPAPADASRQMSLGIPGKLLSNGTYTVTVAGIGPDGGRTDTERYVFNVIVTE
ncbi:anti-sigma factor family protein [Terracidiphilus sp.]|uniref:anti-sigma factor family protein n=1 Tax=Terracidiphilus sp. TaxID=1964191 RepID=UPI003C13411E